DDALDEALSKKILKILIKDPKITQTDLVAILKMSRVTIQRTMKRLVTKGIIIRNGGKRYGYWEINEHTNSMEKHN
ncbi:MAG: winged helix-turn-helix transcriptional regulator, partial [Fibrobacter sp.]|nr:winged helix-turn-helix transcriptional regulator [Fibrobacter sp.]